MHAAHKLGRQWIGIDVTHLAISLIKRRLRDAFGTDAQFETIGVPKDFSAAWDLAKRDKHEFEKWTITLIPDAPPRSAAERRGRRRWICKRAALHFPASAQIHHPPSITSHPLKISFLSKSNTYAVFAEKFARLYQQIAFL